MNNKKINIELEKIKARKEFCRKFYEKVKSIKKLDKILDEKSINIIRNQTKK